MLKLNQQVASLELSRRLKELGVKQESLFYWRLGYSTSESFDKGVSTGKSGHFRDYELKYYPYPRYSTANVKWNETDLSKLDETELSAFTVAELGEMLPYAGLGAYLIACKGMDDWSCAYGLQKTIFSGTEADARAKMLIYLLENKLIKL